MLPGIGCSWYGMVLLCPERWEGVTQTWTEEAYNVLGHRN